MNLVFINTNIIACVRDLRDPAKQSIAEAWLVSLSRSRSRRLSWQVLAEF